MTRQHGVRQLSERDVQLLRFIGEQALVTIPQLAYMTGRSERTARWLRTRWERTGFAEGEKFSVEGPTVIWATGPGLTLADLPFTTVRPSSAIVDRVAACVEVRLAVERHHSAASFVPYRELSYGVRDRHALPDALIKVDGGELALVVVQGERLPEWRLEERVAATKRRYARLLVVAAPRFVDAVRRIDAEAQVVAWRWQPWKVNLPRLPLPGPSQPPVAAETEKAEAAPTPETGAAAAATQRPAQQPPRRRRRRRRGGHGGDRGGALAQPPRPA